MHVKLHEGTSLEAEKRLLMSTRGRSGAAAETPEEFDIDILEPTKEILRCYNEKINPKESWYGGIPQVQNKQMLEHIAVFTQEDVLARVGRISDDFRKKIERVDTVGRLDRRVCELEKENEALRFQRDAQAIDLKVVCREVDTFLDVVQSFLDGDYDRERAPGWEDMGSRASSSSVSKSPILLTLKSRPEPERRTDRDKGNALPASTGQGTGPSGSPIPRKSLSAEKEKGKRPVSPGIRPPSPMTPSPRSSKLSLTIFDKGKRAMSPGSRTASPSPKNGSIAAFNKEKGIRPLSPYNRQASPSPKKAYMNIADTRKRKWPESERQAQDVTNAKVVLPPGIVRWR